MLRSPAPALVVATPLAVGDEVAAGAPGARAREDEDGDGAARAVRGAGQGAARVRGQPGRDRRRARPARADRRRADAAAEAAAEALDLDLPERRRRRRRRRARRPGRGATCPRCCSATTSTPATRAARWPPTSPPATSSRRRGPLAGRRRDGAARRLRRLRRAEPQPAGRRGGARREPGAQPARALPHLPAEPRPGARRAAGRLRRASSSGCCATTASPTSTARPSSRGPSSGCSSPSSARPPRSRWPPRSSSAGSASRPRTPPADAAARELLDRLVAATQLRFPIVGDLARSVRFRWFDQPLVDADRATVLGSVGDELDADRRAARRRRAHRAHRRARRDPRADRPLPRRAAAARRARPRADARGAHQAALPRVRAARPARGDRRRPGRRHGRLPPRRARLPPRQHRSGTHRRAARRQRRCRSCWPRSSATGPAGHQAGRRPLPALARPARPTPTRRPRARRPAGPDAVRGHGAPGRRRSRPRRRARGRLLHLPPRADGVHGRGPSPSAACTRWSGAGSTSGGCATSTLTRLEAPEDVLLLHAVARGNPQDQRLVALAQVRQLVVVRDETGKVTALPHVERALANCLEAVRRARTTLGSGARLDMNHVWLHIWPPVEADLDQLTALQGKVAPMTAGAGIEEVRVEGRDRRGQRPHRADLRAVLVPAGVRGHLHRRARPRRPGSRRSTTTPRRSSGPAAAAWSTPTSSCRWSPASGGSAVEHDLDDVGPARAGRPPLRPEHGGPHLRCRHDPHRRCTPRA